MIELSEQLKIIYNSAAINEGWEEIPRDGSIEYKEKTWTSN
jgi:hypothetical protein